MEELRNDVINRRLTVSMADVETMAKVLSDSRLVTLRLVNNSLINC